MVDDNELLRQYAEEGAQDAFSELVRRNLGWVYQSALRRVGRRADLAQEVAQQVFTILALEARRLCSHGNLGGWLFVATRYAAIRVCRSETRRRFREAAAATLMAEAHSPPDPDWDEAGALMDEALDHLSEMDRNSIIRRFFQGLGFAELGRKIGVSEEAARKRVDRALLKLRHRLKTRGVTSTSAALASLLTEQAGGAESAWHGALAAKALSAAASGTAGMGGAAAMIGIKGVFTLTMTGTQKLLFVAAAAAAVTGAVYEFGAYRAGKARIVTLEADVATWSRRAKQVPASPAPPRPTGTAPLTAADADTDPQIVAMRGAIAKVKQRLAEQPDQSIPEMAYLSGQDWIVAIQRQGSVATDADLQRVLSNLRNQSVENFEHKFGPAWAAYLKDHDRRPPATVAALADYFDPPLTETALLNHYIFLGWMPQEKPAAGEARIGVDPQFAVDPNVDAELFVDVSPKGNAGGGAYGPFTYYELGPEIEAASAAFLKAHPGRTSPPTPTELAPYFQNGADAKRFLQLPR